MIGPISVARKSFRSALAVLPTRIVTAHAGAYGSPSCTPDDGDPGSVQRRGALTISRNHAARVIVSNYSAETNARGDLAVIHSTPISGVSEEVGTERHGSLRGSGASSTR